MSLIQSAQQKLKKIDNSKVFQGIVIAVIILSALLIGAKTHNLSANAVAVLLLLDVAVTIFLLWKYPFDIWLIRIKSSFLKTVGIYLIPSLSLGV
jgi:voltage-gated sodium channel